jgi:hypothetical protein
VCSKRECDARITMNYKKWWDLHVATAGQNPDT